MIGILTLPFLSTLTTTLLFVSTGVVVFVFPVLLLFQVLLLPVLVPVTPGI
jgi:hypothetical protein